MPENQNSLTQFSHPAVRFENVPLIEGRMHSWNSVRPKVLNEIVQKTVREFSSQPLDLLLGEALYSERVRLKRNRPNLFTKQRWKADRKLWNGIQAELLRSPVETDRKAMLERVASHYAEEIGGHFDPVIYKLASSILPFGFNWLLNAASVRRILPWKMTESLKSRLRIVGEIPMLQNLSKRGTILLVPTHQSNIDSAFIGYVIYLMQLPPFAYGAGLNLFSNPAFAFFMNRLGAYTVDRQKTNAIYKAALKNYSTRILREGIHSIFFPGGGRARSGAIESNIKLGLLGTGLQAQLENHLAGMPNPSVFIVPMITSYHMVLEASSLIEDYLSGAGKHRFISMDDESWQAKKVANFFWKFFSSQTSMTVRIGRALDIFGNFVDEQGRSIGPNGTTIDPIRWLTTRGELMAEEQRDHEYTRELGMRLAESFHRENTVLTSHAVAFALFELLRTKYPDLDLFRFLRLSLAQRSVSYTEFLTVAEVLRKKLFEMSDCGELYLCEEFRQGEGEQWILEGVRQLGILHDVSVAKIQRGVIWTEDMNLLYYYRNRLSGYGLSLLAERDGARLKPGQSDAKGFLA